MNREQRRKAAKAAPKKKRPVWAGLTVEEKKEKLFKNGITDLDLKREYDRGYSAARSDLSGFIMKMMYCAVALSLHKLYGFDEDQITETLDEIQQTMCDEIGVQDMFERCKRETGMDIFDSDYDN